MSTPSTSPSNQEAGLKDLTILGATAKKLRRDGVIGEIEDHVLQLLPDPVQSLTKQSPAEVILLRVEAAIARLKPELDPSQLAEIPQPHSQARTDGYGTSDNPFAVHAPPSSQAPVTDSTPSTTAGPASTMPLPDPILSTAPSTTTGPASTVAADLLPKVTDAFQRSESQAPSMASPSYAEKYAGNRDEGRKRINRQAGQGKNET
ncbi:hypothetical protein Neosp_014108 [[Neocosmospora] mangrovei]